MLKKRVVTSLWGILVLVAVIWFDQPLPWFTVLIAVWGLLAAFEFYRMVNTSRALTWFGLIWVVLFVLSPHLNHNLVTPLLLTSAIMLSLIWLLLRRQQENAFVDWAWTIAGIIYLGWLLSHLVILRGSDYGRYWVFFTLFTNIGSDSAAFLVGRTLGHHPLAPKTSPGKTWEGAIAGILFAMLISLLFTIPTPFSLPLSYSQAILLGLLVSIFGQLGDLVESLLKRNMGVKDSGTLVPGHGGALDRIDSLVFAGVIAYYYSLAYSAGWLNWL